MVLLARVANRISSNSQMIHYPKFRHISYSACGAGPRLFLVGAPVGITGFAPLAEGLASEFNVITHDPRGIGHSSRPSGGSVDPQALAEDLADLIRHLSAEPAMIFGSSGGAVTVLALLSHAPELVEKAVLHEPPLFRLLPDAETVLARADQAFT